MTSVVHGLDPRVKLVGTIAFMVTAIAVPPGEWAAYGMLLAFVWLATTRAGLSLNFVLLRSLLVAPFTLAAFPVLFTKAGTSLFALGVGPWTWTATNEGAVLLGSILLRSWLSVQMAILLSATTSMPDLLRAMRSLGLPAVLVAIVSFAYRYLFVIVDEAQRLQRARASRSAHIHPHGRLGGNLAFRVRVTGGMIGSLFLRSLERSERIYAAMLARGYAGEVRALADLRLTQGDRIAAASMGLILIAIIGFAYLI